MYNRPTTPIARQLAERLLILCDEKTVWVKTNPEEPNQSCLVESAFTPKYDHEDVRYDTIKGPTARWLDNFIFLYTLDSKDNGVETAVDFNDGDDTTFEDVILLLEEAIDQAVWEGV